MKPMEMAHDDVNSVKHRSHNHKATQLHTSLAHWFSVSIDILCSIKTTFKPIRFSLKTLNLNNCRIVSVSFAHISHEIISTEHLHCIRVAYIIWHGKLQKRAMNSFLIEKEETIIRKSKRIDHLCAIPTEKRCVCSVSCSFDSVWFLFSLHCFRYFRAGEFVYVLKRPAAQWYPTNRMRSICIQFARTNAIILFDLNLLSLMQFTANKKTT